MYEYIKGKLVELTPTDIIVEAAGVGYRIMISLQSYSAFGKENPREVLVYVHHVVKEDDEELYGFFNRDERALFTQLISVSGVGPGTARMILSSLSSDELREAIISGDVRRIQAVKGIGAKTAQRLILELKDKIVKGAGSFSGSDVIANAGAASVIRDEATTALQLLGFAKPAVEKVLNALLKEKSDYTIEELIKKALKSL